MNRRRFILGASTAALPLAAAARARAAPEADKLEGDRLDPLLAEIAAARKGVRTLRASFTQERVMRLLATSIKSTGQLAFVAPDRLRWELAAPDDVVYWVGPEGLSYRTRSSRATVPSGGSVVRALADLRALLGGDLGSLRERYTLSGSRSAAGATVEGAAKDKAASVRAFSLTLDRSLVLPIRTRLVEGKADTVDIAFSGPAVNGPVELAAMKP